MSELVDREESTCQPYSHQHYTPDADYRQQIEQFPLDGR
jgi:hypothetical protein